MMNIPGLIKIEEMDASSVSFPFFVSEEATSLNIFGSWTEVDFVPGTGGFVCEEKKPGEFTTSLKFLIAGIDTATNNVVKELTQRYKVYRATDVQGTQFIIGSNHFKGRATSIMQNNAPFSGFRGYEIEVIVRSSHKPLLYT